MMFLQIKTDNMTEYCKCSGRYSPTEPVKDVTFKADLFTWGQPYYQDKNDKAYRNNGAFDLNAGVEFSISRSVGLWLDCNNIFNNQYQLLNQYQVLGFNILGGVVFSFGQSR